MKKTLTIILVSSFTFMLAQVPTNGLVGAWVFCGNAQDVTGNNNNGTVYGPLLTTDRFGNANSAYNFNGTSDYIQMLTSGVTGHAARSVSFWARTSSTAHMVGFDYSTVNFNGGAFQLALNYCAPGIGLDVSNQAVVWGNSNLSNNNWHHYVAVLDTNVGIQIGDVIFYVDGVQQPSLSCTVTGQTQNINTGNQYPISIGKSADSFTRYFDGDLDDFYLYNRVLSPAEISNIYNATSLGFPSLTLSTSNPFVCAGASATLSASGATGYIWMPGNLTGSSIVVSPTTNSTYTVTGTSNGCTELATLTQSVTHVSLSASTNNATLCAGSTATLTSSGATTYTWMPGNLAGTSVTIAPSSNTTYTVTGASNGCTSSTTLTQTVIICKETGILSVSPNETAWHLYPNPTPGNINYAGAGPLVSLEVFDALGKSILLLKDNSQNGQIDLSDQPAGIYFVKMTIDKGCVVKKVIKE